MTFHSLLVEFSFSQDFFFFLSQKELKKRSRRSREGQCKKSSCVSREWSNSSSSDLICDPELDSHPLFLPFPRSMRLQRRSCSSSSCLWLHLLSCHSRPPSLEIQSVSQFSSCSKYSHDFVLFLFIVIDSLDEETARESGSIEGSLPIRDGIPALRFSWHYYRHRFRYSFNIPSAVFPFMPLWTVTKLLHRSIQCLSFVSYSGLKTLSTAERRASHDLLRDNEVWLTLKYFNHNVIWSFIPSPCLPTLPAKSLSYTTFAWCICAAIKDPENYYWEHDNRKRRLKECLRRRKFLELCWLWFCLQLSNSSTRKDSEIRRQETTCLSSKSQRMTWLSNASQFCFRRCRHDR